MEIKVTTQYEIFKSAKGNRALSESHLNLMIESLKRGNFLALHPLIVSPDMDLIDGQHRLAAAKALNLPVYYGIVEGSAAEIMALLNENQKRWGVDDWVNHHAQLGLLPYIKLIEVSAHLGRSPFELTRLLYAKSNLSASIKSGTLTSVPEERMREFVFVQERVNEISSLVFDLSFRKGVYARTSRFRFALSSVLRQKELDYEEFKERVVKRMDVMRPCTTVEAYKELFVDIYNYSRHKKLAVYEAGSKVKIDE